MFSAVWKKRMNTSFWWCKFQVYAHLFLYCICSTVWAIWKQRVWSTVEVPPPYFDNCFFDSVLFLCTESGRQTVWWLNHLIEKDVNQTCCYYKNNLWDWEIRRIIMVMIRMHTGKVAEPCGFCFIYKLNFTIGIREV